MQLPLTVSRFSKIQIGFTFLVLVYPGSPGERALNRCVCVCVCVVVHFFRLVNVFFYCVSFSFFPYQAKRLAWGMSRNALLCVECDVNHNLIHQCCLLIF